MLHQLKAFYKNNRPFIIIGLVFIMMLQVCSRGARVEKSSHTELPADTAAYGTDQDHQLKPLHEIYRDEQLNKPAPNPELMSLLVLMTLVLLVYVAGKRGWLEKLAPSFVWIALQLRRNKGSKDRMATISIRNHSKESINFDAPLLVFKKPFKKARRFRLKAGIGHEAFPLTLMPGTAHRISINMDAFMRKANLEKEYRWVRIEVGNGLKIYRSLWNYLL